MRNMRSFYAHKKTSVKRPTFSKQIPLAGKSLFAQSVVVRRLSSRGFLSDFSVAAVNGLVRNTSNNVQRSDGQQNCQSDFFHSSFLNKV